MGRLTTALCVATALILMFAVAEGAAVKRHRGHHHEEGHHHTPHSKMPHARHHPDGHTADERGEHFGDGETKMGEPGMDKERNRDLFEGDYGEMADFDAATDAEVMHKSGRGHNLKLHLNEAGPKLDKLPKGRHYPKVDRGAKDPDTADESDLKKPQGKSGNHHREEAAADGGDDHDQEADGHTQLSEDGEHGEGRHTQGSSADEPAEHSLDMMALDEEAPRPHHHKRSAHKHRAQVHGSHAQAQLADNGIPDGSAQEVPQHFDAPTVQAAPAGDVHAQKAKAASAAALQSNGDPTDFLQEGVKDWNDYGDSGNSFSTSNAAPSDPMFNNMEDSEASANGNMNFSPIQQSGTVGMVPGYNQNVNRRAVIGASYGDNGMNGNGGQQPSLLSKVQRLQMELNENESRLAQVSGGAPQQARPQPGYGPKSSDYKGGNGAGDNIMGRIGMSLNEQPYRGGYRGGYQGGASPQAMAQLAAEQAQLSRLLEAAREGNGREMLDPASGLSELTEADGGAPPPAGGIAFNLPGGDAGAGGAAVLPGGGGGAAALGGGPGGLNQNGFGGGPAPAGGGSGSGGGTGVGAGAGGQQQNNLPVPATNPNLASANMLADPNIDLLSHCDVVANEVCLAGGAKTLAVDACPKGMVGHWTFDDAKAYDQSGHGNHAKSLPLVASGAWGVGSSAMFDGRVAVEIPNSPWFASNEFTVAWWLFLMEDSTGQWRPLIHKGATEFERAPAVYLMPNSRRIKAYVATTMQSHPLGEQVDSQTKIPLRQWVHISVVRTKDAIAIYINGILDARTETNGDTLSNAGSLFLGNDPQQRNGGGTVCLMDELRYYARALSEDEIGGEGAAGLGGMSPSFARLACSECSFDKAKTMCPDGYHMCSSYDMYSGGYQVARSMGWTSLSKIIWIADLEAPKDIKVATGMCCSDNS